MLAILLNNLEIPPPLILAILAIYFILISIYLQIFFTLYIIIKGIYK